MKKKVYWFELVMINYWFVWDYLTLIKHYLKLISDLFEIFLHLSKHYLKLILVIWKEWDLWM